MVLFYYSSMIDKNALCVFLVDAKKSTYASWDATQKILEENWSTTLIFKKGEWLYHDNYFWWEPFWGREVVFYNNQPVFIMTYYWFAADSVSDLSGLYSFLQEALSLVSVDYPYRWPASYNNWKLFYTNTTQGDVSSFSWEEHIMQDGKIIFKTMYMWWLVDQRK